MALPRLVSLTFLLLILQGCGAPPEAGKLIEGNDKKPAALELTAISYVANGSPVNLTAPFAAALSFQPDLSTGICLSFLNEAEVTFIGTYELATTSSLRVIGPAVSNIQLSAGTFTIRTCLSVGSTAVSLAALSPDGQASDSLNFSISISAVLRSLAFGHPLYPSPGFRTSAGSASSSSLVGGSLDSRQFSVSDSTVTSVASTGNTSFRLTVGFPSIVKEMSP